MVASILLQRSYRCQALLFRAHSIGFLAVFPHLSHQAVCVLRWRTEEIISIGASDDFKIPSSYVKEVNPCRISQF